MTEKDFTTQVLEACARNGWLAVHFPTSVGFRGEFRTTYQGNGKGFPDIVAVRAGRTLFAELKIPPNKRTVEQKVWAQEIESTDSEYYLWTPDDWDMIEGVLGRSCEWSAA